ncbi:MAG: radical SAM protein [Clostridiaceae bacterium]|nr:radical SAM protein [Clostridiaceae bacterium]
MKVNEIFLSIQGESMTSGFPTIFVRFTGCNLRCSYCDTAYAYENGEEMTVHEVLEKIRRLSYKRVCLTGGEPLLQPEIESLLDLLPDHNVSIETNGSIDLKNVNIKSNNHCFVMDVKTPSSGCSDQMFFDNFDILGDRDEIKFVIGDSRDYEWSKEIIMKRYIKGIITFSPVFGKMDYKYLIKRILEDRLDVRFQLQLHKIIWGPYKTGV